MLKAIKHNITFCKSYKILFKVREIEGKLCSSRRFLWDVVMLMFSNTMK